VRNPLPKRLQAPANGLTIEEEPLGEARRLLALAVETLERCSGETTLPGWWTAKDDVPPVLVKIRKFLDRS
jgi:hypothetical protein